MRVLGVLLAHRAREIVSTWRVWVLPVLLVLLAVLGPVTARWTRELLDAALGDQAAAIPVPEPTALDAYAQWAKNLSQLAVLVVVVTAAGAINAEVRSGAAQLLLVKPVSRGVFVVSQVVTLTGFVTLTTAVGTVLTWGVTRLLFDDVPVGPLAAVTGSWLVLVVVLVAATALASAAVDAVAGAAGVGVGAFLVLALLGVVPWLAGHTPAGLPGLPGALAAGGHVAWAWPVVTGVVLAVVLTATAVLVFRRREL